jgi:flagellar motor protein MotB
MSKKRKRQEEEGGSADWLMTFADVLTLLITFFVLLISMSSMDSKALKETSAFFMGAVGNLGAGKGRSTALMIDPRNSRPMPRPSLRKTKAGVGAAEQAGDTDELSQLLDQAKTLARVLKDRERFPSSKGAHPIDAAIVELYGGARPVKLVRTDVGGVVSLHIGMVFVHGEPLLRPELRVWLNKVGRTLGGRLDRVEVPVRENGSRARYAAPWLLGAWRGAALVRVLRPGDKRVAAAVFQTKNRSYARLIWSRAAEGRNGR